LAPRLTQAADVGYTITGSTNAAVVLPITGDQRAPVWATGTVYRAGTPVKANGVLYVCAVPGTSGTNVAVFTGRTVTDGTAVWCKARIQERAGLALTVDSVGDVFLSVGGLARSGVGVRLAGGLGPYQVSLSGSPQDQVSIYSTSTVTVTGTEW
jgi:hypothetical protein